MNQPSPKRVQYGKETGRLTPLKHNCMSNKRILRNVASDDLAIFFEDQLNQEASYMAAFTAKDPTGQEAFMAHWHTIPADETVIIQTIIFNGHVAGSVSSYEEFLLELAE